MRSSFEIVNLRRRFVYFDLSYSPYLGATGNQPTQGRLNCEFRYVKTLAVSVQTPFKFQPRKTCNFNLSGQTKGFCLSTCKTCIVLQK
jgi:hypothetical protein